MKALPQPPKSSCRPLKWTELKIRFCIDESRRNGSRWKAFQIRRNWILARMLLVSAMRREGRSFNQIAALINTSPTRCRAVFDAFLKRSGGRRGDYPGYCHGRT